MPRVTAKALVLTVVFSNFPDAHTVGSGVGWAVETGNRQQNREKTSL